MVKFMKPNKAFRPGSRRIFNAAVIGSVLLISYLLFQGSFAMAAEAVGKFTHVEGKVDILREGAFPAITARCRTSYMQKISSGQKALQRPRSSLKIIRSCRSPRGAG